MRTARLLALCATLSTTGCMRGLEDEYRQAVPDANELAIRVPGESGGAAAGAHEEAIVGQRAVLYQVTRDVSRVVNGGVYLVLGTLAEIVRHPASEVDQHHAVWGPYTGALSPLTYRFEVTKVSKGNFEYVLSSKRKAEGDETFAAILTGEAHLDGEAVGAGSFTVDGDAMHTLDAYEWPGSGTAAVVYDLQSEPRSIEVEFDAWTGGWHAPVDATYGYHEGADQSGDFEFSAEADLDGGFSALESLVVTSRWIAGGTGRSDATATGGDVATGQTVEATECWDDGFGRTYWTDSAGLVGTEGDPAACPFDAAATPGE
jgi:hypothetical protein